MVEEYKYKEITGKIIGAAMQVHKVLGNGFVLSYTGDKDKTQETGYFTGFLSTETGFGNVGLKSGEPFVNFVFGILDIKKVIVSGAEKQLTV